ncbi:glutaredoxin family protein [Micromonospora sp. NPDC047620]|uniref:glutaredoxin family protein n=1 Tax=Micromonospora sp. NPDC047620 TaxID=3364251 RepID=UPI003717F268
MTGADHSDHYPTSPGLVVYGTDWYPDVRRSRAVLDAAGGAYHYVDLDQDRAATTLVRRLQHGRRRIPTPLRPDGTFLVEPTDEDLRTRLDQREARLRGGVAGQADFHLLRSSGGVVYGLDSTSGALVASTDRVTWQTRSTIEAYDLAVDPRSPCTRTSSTWPPRTARCCAAPTRARRGNR